MIARAKLHNEEKHNNVGYVLPLCRQGENFTAAISYSSLTLEQLIACKDNFLSISEDCYFKQLTATKRQYSYLLGRMAAKQAISKLVPDIVLNEVDIAWGVFNQPVIQHPHIHNLQVSITHTHNCAMALVFPEQHPMGIDIEDFECCSVEAMRSQINTDEISILKGALAGTERVLTLGWSIKEALSKLLKTGLMTDFSLYAIATSQARGGIVNSGFKYFHQYQAISAVLGSTICSIVLPGKTSINLNVILNALQK